MGLPNENVVVSDPDPVILVGYFRKSSNSDITSIWDNQDSDSSNMPDPDPEPCTKLHLLHSILSSEINVKYCFKENSIFLFFYSKGP